MNRVPLTYEKLDPSLPDLKYHSEGAAGFDLYAAEDFYIDGCSVKNVPTGVRFDIPEGFELQIRLRSSFASEGWVMPNAPGTVDCDYKGEIFIPVMGLTFGHSRALSNGDRIAQAILAPVTRAMLTEGVVEVDTERGEGGFGSTGV